MRSGIFRPQTNILKIWALSLILCAAAFFTVLFILRSAADGGAADLASGKAEDAVPAPITAALLEGDLNAPAGAQELETERCSVSAGYDHSLFISDDGSLFASGGGAFGQLGFSLSEKSELAVKVPLTDVVFALAGDRRSAAIKSDGSLWFWGGEEGVNEAAAPRKLLDGAASVRALGGELLVLKKDGSIVTCIPGPVGSEPAVSPVAIDGKAVSVSAGAGRFLAVMDGGALYAWSGGAAEAIIGAEAQQSGPKKLMDGVRAAAAFGRDTYAVGQDGALWVLSEEGPPQKLGGGVAGISASDSMLAILTDSGALWKISAEDGSRVRMMTDAVSVSVGGRHLLAVSADGAVWAFGANESGQFGVSAEAGVAARKIFRGLSQEQLSSPVEDYTVTVHPYAKVLVAGYKAGVSVNIVSETGASMSGLYVALYSADKRLTTPAPVVNGEATFFSFIPEELAGEVRVGLSVGGGAPRWFDTIEVRYIEGLWEPTAEVKGGYTLVTFAERVALNPEKAVVRINGEAAKMAVSEDKRGIIIWRSIQGSDNLVIISGVKYPALFPNYNFVFTLTI